MNWKKTLIAGWTAQFLSILGFYFVSPFFPLYLQEIGAKTPQDAAFWGGLVSFAGSFALFIFSPLWGAIGDRVGRKPMVLRAFFGSGIFIFFMSFAHSPSQLVFYRFLHASFAGTVSASLSLISTIIPEEKVPFSIGIMQSAIYTGASIGPILGGFLASSMGYRASFYFAFFIYLIGGLIVLFLIHEDFKRPNTQKDVSSKEGAVDIFKLLSIYLIFQFLFTLGNRASYPVLPLLIQELGRGIRDTGFVFGISSIASAISSLFVAKLLERMSAYRLLKYLFFTSALTFFPVYFINTPLQLIIIRTLTGFFVGGIIPAFNSFVTEIIPNSSRGKAFGLTSSAYSLGNAFGPLIGGIVGAHIGFREVFLFSGTLFILCTIGMSLISRRRV